MSLMPSWSLSALLDETLRQVDCIRCVYAEEDVQYLSFFSKNVLVSLVKADNIDQYLDRSAKVYYTGKKFPSTVALNKLYYFMPYMKNKGIRDLYFIKIARVGTKQEVHPECEDNDFRLVFEIEYVGQLYEDYKSIKLDIWRTFTDTTMSSLQIKVKQGE